MLFLFLQKSYQSSLFVSFFFCVRASAYKAIEAQKGIPAIRKSIQARLIYQTIHIVTVFITIATVAVHLGFLFLLF